MEGISWYSTDQDRLNWFWRMSAKQGGEIVTIDGEVFACDIGND